MPNAANPITPTIALTNREMPNRRIGRSRVSGSPESTAATIRRITNRYACICSRRVRMTTSDLIRAFNYHRRAASSAGEGRSTSYDRDPALAAGAGQRTGSQGDRHGPRTAALSSGAAPPPGQPAAGRPPGGGAGGGAGGGGEPRRPRMGGRADGGRCGGRGRGHVRPPPGTLVVREHRVAPPVPRPPPGGAPGPGGPTGGPAAGHLGAVHQGGRSGATGQPVRGGAG